MQGGLCSLQIVPESTPEQQCATYCHKRDGCTGRANKKGTLGKIQYLWNGSIFFSPNLQCLLRSIQATYFAKFIAIFRCIHKL